MAKKDEVQKIDSLTCKWGYKNTAKVGGVLTKIFHVCMSGCTHKNVVFFNHHHLHCYHY